MDRELLANQAGFRKGRGTRDQIANLRWIMERQHEFGQDVHLCFIDYSKAFDCVNHGSNVEYPQRDGNTNPLDHAAEKSVCRPGGSSSHRVW